VVSLLYKREPLLWTRQSHLVPGIDRGCGVSMRACVHNRAQALDAMLAANDVERRQSCCCRTHVFAHDLEVGTRLRGQLHQQGVGYEARFLTLVVNTNNLTQLDYGESMCS